MSKLSFYLSLCLGLLFFSSCEKVIEIELNEADRRTVIEANLSLEDSTFTATVSKTAAYFAAESISFIEDAQLTLTDGAGNSVDIPSTGAGVYSMNYTAVAGQTYTLTVNTEGETYTAEAFLPQPLEISEVYSEFQEGFGPVEDGYNVLVRYMDNADTEDYYRIVYRLNGELPSQGTGIQIFDDNFNNGNEVRRSIFGESFEIGDRVEVEFRHIDKATYGYFNSLSSIIGGRGGAAPGNPLSNWSNNALGYFSAYTTDKGEVVVE